MRNTNEREYAVLDSVLLLLYYIIPTWKSQGFEASLEQNNFS